MRNYNNSLPAKVIINIICKHWPSSKKAELQQQRVLCFDLFGTTYGKHEGFWCAS